MLAEISIINNDAPVHIAMMVISLKRTCFIASLSNTPREYKEATIANKIIANITDILKIGDVPFAIVQSTPLFTFG